MSKKIKIILIGLLSLFLLTGFVGLQIFKDSPKYSLYQVYKAIDKHDYETFKKYVNVEDVSNNVIDKAFASVEEESKNAAVSDDPFSQLGYNIGLGLITQMKPRLKEELISGIKKSVEEGSFKNEYKPKNIINYLTNIKVKKDGKVADVFVKTEGKEDLKLKMRYTNKYWEVFSMDLPTPDSNSDTSSSETTIQAKFDEKVSIGSDWFLTVGMPEDYKSNGYSFVKDGYKYVSIKITYENTTDKPDSYSTSNFKLKDDKDFSYSDTYGGKEPRIESGDLEAKGKVTGYLTFEIPNDNKPKSIVYSGSKSVIFTASDVQ